MKRLSLIFVLGITMLTACMPVAGAVVKPPAGEVTATSSPSGMDAQAITTIPSKTETIIPTRDGQWDPPQPMPTSDPNENIPAETKPTAQVDVATKAPEFDFTGLNICKTWQEASKCPITENDWARISAFVKANYKFPDGAPRLQGMQPVSATVGNSFAFWPSTEGMDKVSAAKIAKNPNQKAGSSLSSLGLPFFLVCKKTHQELWVNR